MGTESLINEIYRSRRPVVLLQTHFSDLLLLLLLLLTP